MAQDYIRLRGAIFAESGYCLAAPRLHRDTPAYFLTKDIDGKTRNLDVVAGCEAPDAKPDSTTTVVPLEPYPDPLAAMEALYLMCLSLGQAIKGDAQARELLATGWGNMLCNGLRLTQQSPPMQYALMQNLYGVGRLTDELNRRGTLQFFEVPSVAAMLDEALPVAA